MEPAGRAIRLSVQAGAHLFFQGGACYPVPMTFESFFPDYQTLYGLNYKAS
jgi:hypothetical protein